MPPSLVSIARLPATSRVLFGREQQLAWLDQCWKNGVHLVSIVAWGGVGKSALVNRWLAGLRDRGWDDARRVFGWSFYSQGTDRLASSDEFFAVALREMGETGPAPTSPWDKGERLAKLVKQERTLLVLDGLEPLQWGPGVQPGKLKDQAIEALVKELAAQNQGMCLITSRITVADLGGPGDDKVQEHKLESLSVEAGAALLMARKVKGTPEELLEAAKEYKGHALALMLLSSYLSDVAEGDVLKRREIGPLELDERLGGHARRVMAAYQPWLAKEELSVLFMLGLFDRPAEDGDIAALRMEPVVPGLTDGLEGLGPREWNKAVEKLRRVGLLAADKDKRLDAHPLVREYFGEQLRRDHPEAWREGHRRLYEHLRGKAKELPETIEEMAPLYAAVVHGCLAGKNEEAQTEVYWKRIEHEREYFNKNILGAFGSEVAILSAFFNPPWERLAPGLTDWAQNSVLSGAGFALRALGRLMEAEGLTRRALERYCVREDWKNAAASAANLGEILHAGGKVREALAHADRSVEFAKKSGDAFQCLSATVMQAVARHAMGLQKEASAHFEEAEHMKIGLRPDVPRLYSVFDVRYCELLLDQGRDVDVRERAAQMLEVVTPKQWPFDIGLSHISLGRGHLLALQRGGGDIHEAGARVHIKQGVEGLRTSGYRDYLPLGLLARAALHIHTRDFSAARRDLDEALTLSTRCGFRLHEADAHLGFARLALAERDPAAARGHLAKARAIIEQTGYHRRDKELAELEAEARTMASTLPVSVPVPVPALFSSSPPLSPTAAPSPAMPASQNKALVDFLIVAPLEEEREAILSKLPGYRRLDADGTDVHVYFEAEVATTRQDKAVYRILVTSPVDMGPTHAAVTAASVAARWQPEHVLVVGIAGGLKDEVAFGDVLVARSVADYTVGKVKEDGSREERWESYPADVGLLSWANTFRTGWEDLVAVSRPKGKGSPVRHAGVIASGGDVITSKDLIARYHKAWPKLIGVEMEGGGVATALHAHKLRPRFLMIRGVSDLADAEGNAATKKLWRAYARDVAAAYAVGFLRSGPVPAAARSTRNPP